MQSLDEISLRVTGKMQRAIESAIDSSLINTKAEFFSQSIIENIGYIHSKLEGQLNIRDFVKDLNCDIEWMHIDIPDENITPKLDVNGSLDISMRTELPNEYHSTLKQCCRSSDFNKSTIIRMCILKKLYDMRSKLPEVREKNISDRWTNVKRKLNVTITKLIDNIYYYFSDDEFINNKINDELEVKNVYYIEKYYSELKNSKGYELMKDKVRGQEVLQKLDSISQKDNIPA